MIYEKQYLSPVGVLTIASDGAAITNLRFHAAAENRSCPVIHEAEKWLDAYFSGQAPEVSALPLRYAGTDFQKSVWEILRTIPYGKTMTYGQIARMLGAKMSAQAVGQAVGRNPIGIIIPCHRVLGAKGRITGYSDGLEIKRFLLRMEKIDYIE